MKRPVTLTPTEVEHLRATMEAVAKLNLECFRWGATAPHHGCDCDSCTATLGAIAATDLLEQRGGL